MTTNGKVKVEPIQDGIDGPYRTTDMSVDDKTIRTPNSCIPTGRTQQFDDLDLRLRIQGQTKGHTGSYVVRTFDFERVLQSRINSIGQVTMNEAEFQQPVFRDFFKGNVFFLDPSAESLEYPRFLRRLALSKRYPIEARDLAQKLIKLREKKAERRTILSRVNDFWGSLLENKGNLGKFLGYTFDYGSQTRANVLLPFTRVIRSEETFAQSKWVNGYWKAICQSKSRPTVAYLMLSSAALRDEETINRICDYVPTLDVDFAVLKIKNLKLTDGTAIQPQETFGRILRAYSTLRLKKPNTVTVALDSGDQIFLNAIKSFDIVSRSSAGSDFERDATGGASIPTYGSALELDEMISMPFTYWKNAFERFGTMPCPHDYCHMVIRTLDTTQYPCEQWNLDRRVHNMLIIDEWMHQISEAVVAGNSRLIAQKLHTSRLRILASIIPNDEE